MKTNQQKIALLNRVRLSVNKFAVPFFAALLINLSMCSNNLFAQVTVTGSTGADAVYLSLTQAGGAFAAINAAGTQAGNNIVLTITADVLTEDGVNSLNASDWNTLTISPGGGAARTISGSVAGPLINLNGADKVLIDGLNTGSNALTITNTAIGASSTVRFIADATNNIIQNCTIKGSTTSTANGVVVFGTGTTTGNDGNNINNCNITAADANLPLNGIFSLGTSVTIDNSGNTINANNISDYFNATSASAGINLAATGNTAWTITNNRLFQSANRTYTSGITNSGISVQTGDSYNISGNIIGFADAAGTGTTNMIGSLPATPLVITGTFPSAYTIAGSSVAIRYIAINCAFTSQGAPNSIQGNTVAGFAMLTSSGLASANISPANTTPTGIFCGIFVNFGKANIGTVNGNIIGSTSGTGSIYTLTTTSGGAVTGILAVSNDAINIQNNMIGAIDAMGSSATICGGITGICADVLKAGLGGTSNVSGNTIGNSTNPNLRMGNLNTGADLSNSGTTFSLTSGFASFFGILNGVVNSVTGSLLETGTIGTSSKPNIIQNALLNSSSSSALIRGIMSNSAADNLTISSNTITNLSSFSTNTTLAGALEAINGIHVVNSFGQIANAIISDNTINNISLRNTGAFLNHLVGISCTQMTSFICTRNKICDLSNLSTGVGSVVPTLTTSPTVAGVVIRQLGLISGQTLYHEISNNMIALGTGQATNTMFFGIWQNGFFQGAGVLNPVINIINNTIDIEGTVTSGANPSCGILRRNFTVATNNGNPLIILNNILVNNRTGGTGKHYAIANDLGLATSSATGWGAGASNYNVLNTANSGTVGYWSGDQAFAGWKAASAGDVNSYNGLPITFVSPCDLHLNMGAAPTALESNGVSGTGIVVDIDNQVRPGPAGSVNGGASAPDLGADEFDGAPASPKITNVTFGRGTCLVTAHNISATVVPTIGTLNSVTLNYNNGTAGSVAMTNPSGDTWVGQIPAASPANRIVTWNITAINSFGITTINVGTSYQDEQTFIASANPNIAINAFGFTNLDVNDSGPVTPGDIYTYSWSPATGLNNASIKNPVFTPQVGGTTVFTVTVTNTTISCVATANVTVVVNPSPPAPACVGGNVCGQGIVNLTATGTGVSTLDSLIWTDSISGQIRETDHSPSTYSPFVTTNGFAYVREVPSTITTSNIGYNAVDPVSNGAGYFGIDYQGLWFKVMGTSNGVIIRSVDIAASNPIGSPYTISIKDTLGNIIAQASGFTSRTNASLTAPFNIETIPLNIFVPYSPTAYFMCATISPFLLVCQSAAVASTAPWIIPNQIQILGYGDLGPLPNPTSIFGTNTFGFFFNWKIATGAFGAPCQAPYNVITPGVATITSTGPTTYCGSGYDTLIAGGDPSWVNFSWSPATGLNTTTGDTVIATPLVTTTYTVSINDGIPGGCSTTKTIKLTVNVPPFSDAGSTKYDTICVAAPPIQFNGSGGSASIKQIGFNQTGTTGLIFNGNLSTRTQLYFSKADLNAAGLFGPGFINSIAFQVGSSTPNATYDNFTVMLDNATGGCFSSTAHQTLGFTAFAGPITVLGLGWTDIVFSNPYPWNGVSDLIIETCFTNANTVGFNSVYFTPTPGCFSRRSTNGSGCSDPAGALSVNRPNVRFTGGNVFYKWTPATNLSADDIPNPLFTPTTQGAKKYFLTVTDSGTLCVRTDSVEFVIDDTPKTPTASILGCVPNVTSLSICDSGSATLTTIQRDASFQWQRSSNNVNFADIPGANSATYTTSVITSDTYYRVKAICVDSAFSNSIFLDVFNLQLVSTQGDTICGPGFANLKATANPGEFVRWFSDSTTTTVLANGENYTTGFLLQTDTVWATAITDTATLNWSGGGVIIHDNAVGTPYPSTITVAGLNSSARLKSVLINGFEHTFPGDVGFDLESPSLDLVGVLSGEGGGNSLTGVDLVLENCAPALPSALVNGTFAPSNPLNFTGSMNGIWSLYVEDFFAGDSGLITSWGLVFERIVCSAPSRIPVVAVVTPPPAFDATTPDDSLCKGESTSINVIVGVPAYQNFLWSPSAGLNTTTGISVVATPSVTTNYVVHAIDNGINQCNNYDTVKIVVSPIPTLIVSSSITNGCGGFVANLSASGSGGVSYLWTPSTGLSSATVANPTATVASGTSIEYHILVTDLITGCSKEDSITLTAYNNTSPVITPGDSLLCGGSDFLQYVVDETGPFAGGYPAGTTVDWVIDGTLSLTGLAPSQGVSTSGLSTFQAIVHLPALFGNCTNTTSTALVTYHVLNVTRIITPSTCGNANGKIVANVVGTAPFRYIWSDNVGVIRDFVSNNAKDSIINLPGGNYTFTVIDNNGLVNPGPSCNSGSLTYTVPSNGGPSASITVHADVLCAGESNGSATVIQTGGISPISYEWFPYGGTSATTNVLGAGNYYVLVTDVNGCFDTAQVIIGEPDPLQITVSSINATCNVSNGVGVVMVQGGTLPYSYIWYDELFNDLGVNNDTITGLPADTFYVVVIDANNCNAIETVIINQNCATLLNLKAFIEGFYLGGSVMQPVMWNSCFALTNDSNCYPNLTDCDIITVELHDQLSPAIIVPGGAVTAMLHVDGTAQAVYPGNIQGGTYWIVVRNRTIVETWSSQPVTFSGVTTSYNFTMIDTMAYGNNMRQMAPNVYAMYSGDIDDGTFTPLQDGSVDAFDFLMMDVDIQSGNSGYYVTDVNGDGFVDAFDFLVLDPNIQLGISRLTPP